MEYTETYNIIILVYNKALNEAGWVNHIKICNKIRLTNIIYVVSPEIEYLTWKQVNVIM